ncbi:peptidoglycan-binding protein [Luteolibacter pohnpeiensis]|uniref:Peptidoglycan-binding protein n=1 Tax=Luteolibacter pohnpeiensis TaxID=454153 RepID=A0A934S4W6_9BACT|nr:peptidoglycan-binding domain-containing protein [Luteolibacter pohnpeiensis]MBK1883180.1 peptidoglycan-binding protein [Luteolibacter pohnpeiensis]
MKTIHILALGATLSLTTVIANAAPHDNRYDQNYRAEPYQKERKPAPRKHISIETKAQIRLRELGYYRGAIDGDFGPQSTRALVRYQRDHRLPATARLDTRTLRSLKLS